MQQPAEHSAHYRKGVHLVRAQRLERLPVALAVDEVRRDIDIVEGTATASWSSCTATGCGCCKHGHAASRTLT
jgi:hypothetical protein